MTFPRIYRQQANHPSRARKFVLCLVTSFLFGYWSYEPEALATDFSAPTVASLTLPARTRTLAVTKHEGPLSLDLRARRRLIIRVQGTLELAGRRPSQFFQHQFDGFLQLWIAALSPELGIEFDF